MPEDDYSGENMEDIPWGYYIAFGTKRKEAEKKAMLQTGTKDAAHVQDKIQSSENTGGSGDPSALRAESKRKPITSTTERQDLNNQLGVAQGYKNRSTGDMRGKVYSPGDYGGLSRFVDPRVSYVMKPIIVSAARNLARMYVKYHAEHLKRPPSIQDALDLTLMELGGRDLRDSNSPVGKQSLNRVVRRRMERIAYMDAGNPLFDPLAKLPLTPESYKDFTIRGVIDEYKKDVYNAILNDAPKILEKIAPYGNRNRYGRNFSELTSKANLRKMVDDVRDRTEVVERTGRRRKTANGNMVSVPANRDFKMEFKSENSWDEGRVPKEVKTSPERTHLRQYIKETPRLSEFVFTYRDDINLYEEMLGGALAYILDKEYRDKYLDRPISEIIKEVSDGLADEIPDVDRVDFGRMDMKRILFAAAYGDNGLQKAYGWDDDELVSLAYDEKVIGDISEKPSRVRPSEQAIADILVKDIMENKGRLYGFRQKVKRLQKEIALREGRVYPLSDVLRDENGMILKYPDGSIKLKPDAEPVDPMTWNPGEFDVIEVDPPNDKIEDDDRAMSRIMSYIIYGKDGLINQSRESGAPLYSPREISHIVTDNMKLDGKQLTPRGDRPFLTRRQRELNDPELHDTMAVLDRIRDEEVPAYTPSYDKGAEPQERIRPVATAFDTDIGRLNNMRAYLKRSGAWPDIENNWFVTKDEDSQALVDEFIESILDVADEYIRDDVEEGKWHNMKERIPAIRAFLEAHGDELKRGEMPEYAQKLTKAIQSWMGQMRNISSRNDMQLRYSFLKPAYVTGNSEGQPPIVRDITESKLNGVRPEDYVMTEDGADTRFDRLKRLRADNAKIWAHRMDNKGPRHDLVGRQVEAERAKVDDEINKDSAVVLLKQALIDGDITPEQYGEALEKRRKEVEQEYRDRGLIADPKKIRQIDEELAKYKTEEGKRALQDMYDQALWREYEDSFGPKPVRQEFKPRKFAELSDDALDGYRYQAYRREHSPDETDPEKLKEIRAGYDSEMEKVDDAKKAYLKAQRSFDKFQVYVAIVTDQVDKWASDRARRDVEEIMRGTTVGDEKPQSYEKEFDKAREKYVKKALECKKEIESKGDDRKAIMRIYRARKARMKAAKEEWEDLESRAHKLSVKAYDMFSEEEKERERKFNEEEDARYAKEVQDYEARRDAEPIIPEEYIPKPYTREKFKTPTYIPPEPSPRDTATEEDWAKVNAAIDGFNESQMARIAFYTMESPEERKELIDDFVNEICAKHPEKTPEEYGPIVTQKVEEYSAKIASGELSEEGISDAEDLARTELEKYPWRKDKPYEEREKKAREKFETSKKNKFKEEKAAWKKEQDKKEKDWNDRETWHANESKRKRAFMTERHKEWEDKHKPQPAPAEEEKPSEEVHADELVGNKKGQARFRDLLDEVKRRKKGGTNNDAGKDSAVKDKTPDTSDNTKNNNEDNKKQSGDDVEEPKEKPKPSEQSVNSSDRPVIKSFREMQISKAEKAGQERGLPAGATMTETLPAYYRTVKMDSGNDKAIGLSVYEHEKMGDSEGKGTMKTRSFREMMEKPKDVTNGSVKKGE